ncbi:hypothetical protein EV426DRAFT_669465 [Tirmania nivea]|nr:hypothetical protein EV426DRAFT_669465 [Tirmania nivea]
MAPETKNPTSMASNVHHTASMSTASASVQQNLFTPPSTPTIPLISRPPSTHTFTPVPTPALAPTLAKPSTSVGATKALLIFPAFTDGKPFSIVAQEEVETEVEVDRCKAKAKAKAAWVREQQKLREEWVMDVFRRTGRVPMYPWPGAHWKYRKVEVCGWAVRGMCEKKEEEEKAEEEEEEEDEEKEREPLVIAALGDGGEETENEKEKA